MQALLELAAELGTRDQRAEVERNETLVLQRLGHITVHDALREAFGDGRLADAGLADEHRIVLGAPREHLNHAADLLVAADHRIELPLARHLGEVTRELLQRLILVLRRLVGDLVGAANGLERREERLLRDAERFENPGGVGALGVGEADEDVLGGHVLVAERLRDRLGVVEQLRQFPRERRVGVRLLRITTDLPIERRTQRGDVDAEFLQDRHDDPFLLIEQHAQEMGIVNERIAGAARERERVVQRIGGFDGEAIGVQHGR